MFVLVACVCHLRSSFLANTSRLNETTRRFLIVCSSLKFREAMDDSKTICEGQARMTFGENSKVFYNPVQEFNRDISIVMLNLIAEDVLNNATGTKAVEKPTFRILEALSATGLRSIRYAKEIAGVTEVVANDLSKYAVEMIKKNVEENNISNIVTPNHADATLFMSQHRNEFDVIDLDPFGCPSIFLDSAVQSVKNGGVLLVTATDMAVLAGNAAETCYVKYGAISIRSKACHEMALRILLQCISAHANRYGKYIEPLFSMSVDFYIRVAVRVRNGPNVCKFTTSKLAMVFHCVGCDIIKLQPLGVCQERENKVPKFHVAQGPVVSPNCEHCNYRHTVGGPIWTGPLFSKPFLDRMSNWSGINSLTTERRIQGIVAVMEEELDAPLYYVVDQLCAVLKVQCIPIMTMRSAVLNAGYKVSYSHCNRMSLKTDAPVSVIWDIMRAWEKLNPARRDRFLENSVAANILSKEPSTQIDFSPNPAANPPSREAGLIRFQVNPAAFWGPGARSHARVLGEETSSKSKRNQGKRKAKDSLGGNRNGKKPRQIEEAEKS